MIDFSLGQLLWCAVVPWLLGSGLLARTGLAARHDRTRALAWGLAGGALLLAALVLLMLALAVPDFVRPYGVTALAVLFYFTRPRLGAANGPPIAAAEGRGGWLVLGILAGSLVLLDRGTRTSLTPVLTGDESIVWSAKAKALHAAENLGESYREKLESMEWARHPDYPLFQPLLQVWCFQVSGGIGHFASRMPNFVLALALLLLLSSALRRWLPAPLAACGTLLVCLIPTLQSAAVHASADLMVALGALLAMDAAARWHAGEGHVEARLFWVALAFLAWSKWEGMLLAGVAAAVVLCCRGPRRMPAVRWSLAPLTVVACTLLVNACNHWSADLWDGAPGGERFPALFVGQFAERIGPTVSWLVGEVLLAPTANHWILLSCLVLAVLFPRQLGQEPLRGLTLFLVLSGSLVALVYVGSWRELHWHLSTSAHRVFLQLVPVAALWLGVAWHQLHART